MSYKGLIDLSRSVRAFFFPRWLLSAAARPLAKASATVFLRDLGLSSGPACCCWSWPRVRVPRRAVRWGKLPIIRFEFGTSPARSARPGGACRLALGIDCSGVSSESFRVTFVALEQSAMAHEGRGDGPALVNTDHRRSLEAGRRPPVVRDHECGFLAGP